MNPHALPLAIHWFRRDLRLDDNPALNAAHQSGLPVVPLFIFDTEILDELPPDDPRVYFIYQQLELLNRQIGREGGGLLVRTGKPEEVIRELVTELPVKAIYTNRDYEPYALQRDLAVEQLLHAAGASFHSFQDSLLLEPGSVVKGDGQPYAVFTPFKKRWLEVARNHSLLPATVTPAHWGPLAEPFPSLESLGFRPSDKLVQPLRLEQIRDYGVQRDRLSSEGTHLGPHLRFGTISIRKVYQQASDPTFLSQLIWREFFAHILFFHPRVVHQSFRREYDRIQWRNNEEEFRRWCEGRTGFPMVDAGMRQLNETGYMHNRARMIAASFLCKHLLIDWRWGEQYFAGKLLDFELASNNGSWQWAAGTGCDAAPYFRVFSPSRQQERFDPHGRYVSKWIRELQSLDYPAPIVDHAAARERALRVYAEGISD